MIVKKVSDSISMNRDLLTVLFFVQMAQEGVSLYRYLSHCVLVAVSSCRRLLPLLIRHRIDISVLVLAT